jgi:hypothetical protein
MTKKATALAQLILAVRDDRSHFFDDDLFDEQPWEFLLRLFVAAQEGQVQSRSSLLATVIGSDTLLERWITVLSGRKLLLAEPGPNGAITLTPEAQRRMDELLSPKAQSLETDPIP